MSAICGLVSWREEATAAGQLRQMLDALAHRGLDGSGTWHRGPALFGHQALHCTAESALQHQPLHWEAADLAITADVRLDNRDDLIRKLALSPQRGAEYSDALLMLHAYDKWHEGFVNQLVGAFAFALWDGRRRRLLLGRDALGHGRLFYRRRGESIAFASEAKAIRAIRPAGLDTRAVAMLAYPAARSYENERTFFDGILALPAASLMLVDAAGMRQVQYWRPDEQARLEPRRDEEVLEALQELMQQVIAAQTRSHLPVAAFLSGGLDSSAITAVGSRILAAQNRELLTLSSVASPNACLSGRRPVDEREFIDLFRTWPNIRQRFIDTDELGPLDDFERRIAATEAPNLSTRHYVYAAAARAASEAGARVILDGRGGEASVSCHGSGIFLEWLLSGRWAHLARELRLTARVAESGLWPLIRHHLLKPLFPDALLQLRERRRSPGPFALQPGFLAAQLGPHHARRYARPQLSARHGRSSHRRIQSQPAQPARCGSGVAAYAGYERVEPRYPLLDQRLVEFCLAAPSTVKIHDGYARYAVRGALRGILPEEIRLRTGKQPFSPDYGWRYNRQRAQAVAYLAAIGPKDPVRAVVDVEQLKRWAGRDMTSSRFATAEDRQAGQGVPHGLYLIAFLRQFPEFRP